MVDFSSFAWSWLWLRGSPGKYLSSWVVYVRHRQTFLYSRHNVHHFGTTKSSSKYKIQMPVWARNSCEDMEGGPLFLMLGLPMFSIIFLKFRSHKYITPFSEHSWDDHEKYDKVTRGDTGWQSLPKLTPRSKSPSHWGRCSKSWWRFAGDRGSVRNEFTWICAKASARTSAFWNMLDPVKSNLMYR